MSDVVYVLAGYFLGCLSAIPIAIGMLIHRAKRWNKSQGEIDLFLASLRFPLSWIFSIDGVFAGANRDGYATVSQFIYEYKHNGEYHILFGGVLFAATIINFIYVIFSVEYIPLAKILSSVYLVLSSLLFRSGYLFGNKMVT